MFGARLLCLWASLQVSSSRCSTEHAPRSPPPALPRALPRALGDCIDLTLATVLQPRSLYCMLSLGKPITRISEKRSCSCSMVRLTCVSEAFRRTTPNCQVGMWWPLPPLHVYWPACRRTPWAYVSWDSRLREEQDVDCSPSVFDVTDLA